MAHPKAGDHQLIGILAGLPKNNSAQRIAATQLGLDCAAAARETIGLERAASRRSTCSGCRGKKPNLATVNQVAQMPTAGGESIFAVHNFCPYIAGGPAGIMMPVANSCAGLLALEKISAIAEGPVSSDRLKARPVPSAIRQLRRSAPLFPIF